MQQWKTLNELKKPNLDRKRYEWEVFWFLKSLHYYCPWLFLQSLLISVFAGFAYCQRQVLDQHEEKKTKEEHGRMKYKTLFSQCESLCDSPRSIWLNICFPNIKGNKWAIDFVNNQQLYRKRKVRNNQWGGGGWLRRCFTNVYALQYSSRMAIKILRKQSSSKFTILLFIKILCYGKLIST